MSIVTILNLVSELTVPKMIIITSMKHLRFGELSTANANDHIVSNIEADSAKKFAFKLQWKIYTTFITVFVSLSFGMSKMVT